MLALRSLYGRLGGGPRTGPRLAARTSLALAATCMLSVLPACADFDNPIVEDLGDAPRCAFYSTWESDWSARELDMVLAVSSLRGLGGSCGSGDNETVFGANAPLVTQVPQLRCAAREHAANMGNNKALTHTSGDGRGPAERIYDAGYTGIPRGELIARGDLDPKTVLSKWLADPEQCAAIFDRELDEVGAGLFVRRTGKQPYWVLTLGTRRGDG